MKKYRYNVEVECECGMKIKGRSKIHAEKNLITHKATSKRHEDRMSLIKKVKG